MPRCQRYGAFLGSSASACIGGGHAHSHSALRSEAGGNAGGARARGAFADLVKGGDRIADAALPQERARQWATRATVSDRRRAVAGGRRRRRNVPRAGARCPR